MSSDKGPLKRSGREATRLKSLLMKLASGKETSVDVDVHTGCGCHSFTLVFSCVFIIKYNYYKCTVINKLGALSVVIM